MANIRTIGVFGVLASVLVAGGARGGIARRTSVRLRS